MIKCDKCNSERLLAVSGKSSDMNHWEFGGISRSGYLPSVPNVCDGDYTDFCVCLECGKIQGKFPVDDPDQEEY